MVKTQFPGCLAPFNEANSSNSILLVVLNKTDTIKDDPD